MKHHKWKLMVATLLSLLVIGFAVTPLFHPGLFPTIDNISVIRLEAMAEELRAGQIPVRHVDSLARGHGYMLFGYYAPLPFYTGALMHLVGVNLVGALKRSYLFAVLLGSFGVFGLSYEFFGVFGAVIALAAYAFSPFVGYDVFWRGGLGEVWAMGFVPWILWFSFRSVKEKNIFYAVGAAVSFAGLMTSHNLTAYMGVGFIILWITAWVYRFKKGIREALIIFGGGLGLSAFFWMPAFMSRQIIWVSYLQADRAKVVEGLLQGTLKNIFFPSFIPMITNWTALLLPVLGWVVVRKRVKDASIRHAVTIAGGLFVCSAFFVSGFSRPLWDVLYPVLYIFQFPWRFFTMMTIFGAILTGGLVYVVKRRRLLLVIVVVVMIVTANIANFRPTSYEFIDKYRPQDPCGTSWGFEYLPVWVKTCLKTSWVDPYRVVSGDVRVTSIQKSPRALTLTTEGTRESTLQIAYYDYPGWIVMMDGKPAATTHDNDYGIIEISFPQGKHVMEISLQNTLLWRLSLVLSVVTGCFLVVTGFWEVILFRRKRTSRLKRV